MNKNVEQGIFEVVKNQKYDGLYDLNQLFFVSGLPNHKRPSCWLRNEQTKKLIAELKEIHSLQGNLGDVIITKCGGVGGGGTYANEVLAVSYAGWLDPLFQIKVNKVFLTAYRAYTAKLTEELVNTQNKVGKLENKLSNHKRDLDVLRRINKTKKTYCVTDAAKILQIRPYDLFEKLLDLKWIYRRKAENHYVAHQKVINQKLLEQKLRQYSDSLVFSQARITQKGLNKLAVMLNG